MRDVLFRVLAGLLSVAFVTLLVFGDTSKLSHEKIFGIAAIGIGFGLYALFGSDIGERFIWVVSGGRDPGSDRPFNPSSPTKPNDPTS